MNDKNDLSTISVLFDEAEESADELHKKYSDGAKLTGYIRDRLVAAKPYWVSLSEKYSNDPEVAPTVASGIDFLKAYNQELNNLNASLPYPQEKLISIIGSGEAFDVNTASIADVIPIENFNFEHQPCPFIDHSNAESRAIQLENLDVSLAKTYLQVWEDLHSTRSDPERAALYLMRQTYDHFFAILAPDGDVRQSDVWKEKAGDKPDQVTRIERIEYAALSHISDQEKAKMMIASAKPILKVYDELNRAHKRGEVNPAKARNAIHAMDTILSEWLNAIDS